MDKKKKFHFLIFFLALQLYAGPQWFIWPPARQIRRKDGLYQIKTKFSISILISEIKFNYKITLKYILNNI